jgi:hypothetical protein
MTATTSMTALLGEGMGGLSDLSNSDLVAALLIMLLGIVLGVGVTCTFLVVHFVRKGRHLSQAGLRPKPELLQRERRLRSLVFNLPARWIAIKSANPRTVQAALGLHNPTPCSWEEGLNATHGQKLFISPPVRGWILVMGPNLPEPGEDVDMCFRFVVELSRKLGQVQFFSVNRAVNHHSWVLADSGSIQRAYSWAGRTTWNQGRKTRAEFDLGLKCFDYGEGEDRVEYGRIDPAVANTERLPLLAARWSIDPTSIDSRTMKENQGIAGRLSRSAAP